MKLPPLSDDRGLYNAETGKLRDYVRIDEKTPPMFFAHAFDDRVPVQNCLLPYLALKQAGVPSELHIYDRGGHGYGLRPTDEPVTHWPARCAEWLSAAKIVR